MDEKDIILQEMVSECLIVADYLDSIANGKREFDPKDAALIAAGIRDSISDATVKHYRLIRDVVNCSIHYFSCLDHDHKVNSWWSGEVREAIKNLKEGEADTMKEIFESLYNK